MNRNQRKDQISNIWHQTGLLISWHMLSQMISSHAIAIMSTLHCSYLAPNIIMLHLREQVSVVKSAPVRRISNKWKVILGAASILHTVSLHHLRDPKHPLAHFTLQQPTFHWTNISDDIQQLKFSWIKMPAKYLGLQRYLTSVRSIMLFPVVIFRHLPSHWLNLSNDSSGRGPHILRHL